jgi:DNA mismatch endonuclease (patch repair protein)
MISSTLRTNGIRFMSNAGSRTAGREDSLTPEQRSHCMSRIRSVNSAPEKRVRSALFKLGYRFRLHRRNLPGCPDIVLPRHHKIIFVHGCFWHMHDCRYGRVVPKTNRRYWIEKRVMNAARDRQNARKLRRLGWKVLIIWECWTKNHNGLDKRIKEFLSEA